MKSKLFTPKLNAPQATVLDAEERAPIFMNPPTHAEVPVYDGPTGGAGQCHPLSLDGSGAPSTKHVTRRTFASKQTARSRY